MIDKLQNIYNFFFLRTAVILDKKNAKNPIGPTQSNCISVKATLCTVVSGT